MVDDAIDRSDGHGGIREGLVPLAERLVAGDDEAAAFVTLGNELEENGRFGLVFANIAEIIEDKGVVAVELCKSCRQGEIAAGTVCGRSLVVIVKAILQPLQSAFPLPISSPQ